MYAEVFSYETQLETEGLVNRRTEYSALPQKQKQKTKNKKKSFFLPASVFPHAFPRYIFITANLVVPKP